MKKKFSKVERNIPGNVFDKTLGLKCKTEHAYVGTFFA